MVRAHCGCPGVEIYSMKTYNKYGQVASRLVWLLWLIALAQPIALSAAEETFAVLQIGARTYTNVTVTTKAKTYVFLLHSSGMDNVKVADLPPDVRQKLGYVDVEKAKAGTNSASAWATKTIAKMETPQVKEVKRRMEERWRASFPTGAPTWASIDKKIFGLGLGIALLLYLFFSYCCMLICQKAGKKPGVLVWLPILQKFALLRAANMSCWWFVAYFVPVLNLVAAILWCFKIAKARGKTAWVGLFLLLPIIHLFAFLYLAFSDGAPEKEAPRRRVEIMTLETA